MKIKHLLNAVRRAGAVVVVAGLSAAASSSAQAAPIFFDDFESYADTAALNAVWPIGTSANTTQIFLDNGPAGSTNISKAVHSTNRLGRLDRTFVAPAPTASEPLVVQYDLYDAGPGGNEYIQLLANNSAGALSQLIALGKSSLGTTNGANNPNKYQARVAFPAASAGGVNWINLNTNRSVGWHTFRAEIFPTTVNFYVDGVLDTGNVPRMAGVGDAFSIARIGSGLSSIPEEAYYDNYLVAVVPEPATVGLLALGGLATLMRRRRPA